MDFNLFDTLLVSILFWRLLVSILLWRFYIKDVIYWNLLVRPRTLIRQSFMGTRPLLRIELMLWVRGVTEIIDEALNLFQWICHKKIILDAIIYTSLIDGLCKLGRIATVKEIANSQMHAHCQIPNIYLFCLIDVLCKSQHLA